MAALPTPHFPPDFALRAPLPRPGLLPPLHFIRDGPRGVGCSSASKRRYDVVLIPTFGDLLRGPFHRVHINMGDVLGEGSKLLEQVLFFHPA